MNLKLRLEHLAVMAYIGPAGLALYLAPAYGYNFSPEAVAVILASVVAAAFGLALSTFSGRRPPIPHQHSLSAGTLDLLACAFLMLGSAAMIINFITVQSIPLLQQGAGRIVMSTNVLWNIYIFCGLGLFFYATRIMSFGRTTHWGNALVGFYILLALASAWKGTALYMFILFMTPLLRGRALRLSRLLIVGAILTFLFFAINGMRSANNSFADLINQPVYYLIWGFVNFDAEAIGHVSSCLHSIPGFGCRFEVHNPTLIMPAFNTYSALAPLYLDGGIVLVAAVFFLVSFVLGIAAKRDGMLNNYVFFLCVYFLFLAHNGYMFYSKTYLAGFAFIAALNLVADLARRRGIYSVSHR